jgi:hypothetical protein
MIIWAPFAKRLLAGDLAAGVPSHRIILLRERYFRRGLRMAMFAAPPNRNG